MFRAATISDVAREAGVAQSTVSLVLNRGEHVSPDTRARVQEVMQRLNYQPRRHKVRPRRHVVVAYAPGLLVDGALVNYCRQWIAGIREALRDAAYDMTLIAAQRRVMDDPLFQKALQAHEFDCLVSMGLYEQHGYLEAAMAQGVPVLSINHLPQRGDGSSVSQDYQKIGTAAAERLLALGHRQMALLVVPQNRWVVQQLRQGFCAAVVAAGGTLFEPVAEDLAPEAAAQDALAGRLLAAGVTACFAGSTVLVRLAAALERQGAQLPRDVSLLGLDHLPRHTPGGLRLDTIGHEPEAMARTVASVLEHLLAPSGDLTSIHALVRHVWRPGQTLGPVERTGLAIACAATPLETPTSRRS